MLIHYKILDNNLIYKYKIYNKELQILLWEKLKVDYLVHKIYNIMLIDKYKI